MLYSCQAYLWTLLRCLFAFARALSENSKLVGGKAFFLTNIFNKEHHHNLNTLPTTPFTYSCNTHPFYSVFTALSSWGQSGLVNRRLSLGTFAGNCSRLPVRYQPPPPPPTKAAHATGVVGRGGAAYYYYYYYYYCYYLLLLLLLRTTTTTTTSTTTTTTTLTTTTATLIRPG